MTTMTIPMTVALPDGPREWQLYDDPQARAAAAALTTALAEFLTEASAAVTRDTGAPVPRPAEIREALGAAWKRFEAVQRKWQDVGAYDTEPCDVAAYVVRRVLPRAAEILFG